MKWVTSRKGIVTILIIVLLVYWASQDPVGFANTIRGLGDLLKMGADAIVTFLKTLTSG